MYVLIDVYISGRPWPTAINRQPARGYHYSNTNACSQKEAVWSTTFDEFLSRRKHQNSFMLNLCAYNKMMKRDTRVVLSIFLLYFARLRRNNFLSPCNGFHDEFHILIRYYDEYVTVFRRDQF